MPDVNWPEIIERLAKLDARMEGVQRTVQATFEQATKTNGKVADHEVQIRLLQAMANGASKATAKWVDRFINGVVAAVLFLAFVLLQRSGIIDVSTDRPQTAEDVQKALIEKQAEVQKLQVEANNLPQ